MSKDKKDNYYMLYDLLQGENSIVDKELWQGFSFQEIHEALELLKNNPNLSNYKLSSMIDNIWRINYRIKPPSMEEFLTEEWLGEVALKIYPYIREILIDFFDPSKDYRHLLLSLFISAGKSFASVLMNLFITVNLWCMRNPKKYLNLNISTTLVQILISFSEEKAKEILLSPFKEILLAASKFDRCRTEDSLLKKQKEYGDSRICFTTAGTFALQFSHGLNYKIASRAHKLLGLSPVSATFSELSFFVQSGFSYDEIWNIYQKAKTRVYSRMRGNYFCRTCIDTSPLDQDLSPIDKYIFSGEAEKPDSKGKYLNYIVKGAEWEYKIDEYEDINDTFSVFVGGGGKEAKILKNKEEEKNYPKDLILNPPVELRSHFEDNLIENIRDLGGMPTSSPNRLITNYDLLEKIFSDTGLKTIEHAIKAPANMLPENLIWNQIRDLFFIKINNRYEFYRNSREKRYIHIDQSESGDLASIAMCHVELTKEGDKIYIIDFIINIIPDKYKINLDAISELIFDLVYIGKINIGLVTFDQYQSSATIQRFNRKNINTKRLSVDSDPNIYDLLGSLILNEKLKSGKNIFLKNNLKSIQETKTKTGKRRYDHTNGKRNFSYDYNWKRSSCGTNANDTSDATAGAVYDCMQEFKGTPRYIYEPFQVEDESKVLEDLERKYNLIVKEK